MHNKTQGGLGEGPVFQGTPRLSRTPRLTPTKSHQNNLKLHSVLEGNIGVNIYLAVNSRHLPSYSPLPSPQGVSPWPNSSRVSLFAHPLVVINVFTEGVMFPQPNTLRSQKAGSELGRSMATPYLSGPCCFRSCLLGWDIWVCGDGLVMWGGRVSDSRFCYVTRSAEEGDCKLKLSEGSEVSGFASQGSTNISVLRDISVTWK